MPKKKELCFSLLIKTDKSFYENFTINKLVKLIEVLMQGKYYKVCRILNNEVLDQVETLFYLEDIYLLLLFMEYRKTSDFDSILLKFDF